MHSKFWYSTAHGKNLTAVRDKFPTGTRLVWYTNVEIIAALIKISSN